MKVADALGATGFRATNLQEFEDAMKQAIELNKPVVIDRIIGKDDKVWPDGCWRRSSFGNLF